MALNLITTFTGVDSFGQEVELDMLEHTWITDKLTAYAGENAAKLKALLNEEEEVDDFEESENPDALQAGYLLIYYYFEEWFEAEVNDEPEFLDVEYPCVAVSAENLGLDEAKVLALLNTLVPVNSMVGAN